MTVYALKQIIAAFCVWLLVYQPSPSWAWQSDSQGLEIIVLRGDGTTHRIKSGRFEKPLVEVRLDGQPLKGASVGFELPESGPGGSFDRRGQYGTEHRTTLGVMTGKNGRAIGEGFVANREPGDYVIRVTARSGNMAADAELRQTNAWFDSAMTGKKIKVKLKDGRVMKGPISQISEDSFLLVDGSTGQPVTIANEEVADYSGSTMPTWGKVAIAAGVVFGVLMGIAVAVCSTGYCS